MYSVDSSIPGSTGPRITSLTSSVAVTSSTGPNNPATGSLSTTTDSTTGTTDQNTTGIGSSSTVDPSVTQARLKLEELIAKKEKRLEEFLEQY
ncbi:hypothetical protein OPT61_g994 [Boeremia exigua]|uniref:Uncharacterized protein n=1 Tax=Boeremia exigua TaxID=749465 RepID=A0ACC2IS25_9PLEO|nr:hypothetical protein OPT61_g994 [Boeremia exigua]